MEFTSEKIEQMKRDYNTLNFIKTNFDSLVQDYGIKSIDAILESLTYAQCAVNAFRAEKGIDCINKDEQSMEM